MLCGFDRVLGSEGALAGFESWCVGSTLNLLSEDPAFIGSIWEFPKIGDPNIEPEIVGSLL